MTRRFRLFLCVTLVSIPTLTDWAVDRRFRTSEPTGYTRQQRDAMSRLVERSVAPAYRWRTHRAAVVADVLGLTPQELDSPVNIWGERGRK